MRRSHRRRDVGFLVLLATLATLGGGCASYLVPGRAADLAALGLSAKTRAELTEGSIRELLERRALAAFPVNMAVVRVQCSGYRSETARGYGSGRYSVVLERDTETDGDFGKLEKLPDVRGLARLGRLLLPEHLQSNHELRRAAASLRAEMLLVYTLDTTFRVDDNAKPLTIVTLGLFPGRKTWVQTTASALLVDVRNGYLYGLAEATRKQDQTANAWTSKSTVDRARRKTESEAFSALVKEIEGMWGRVVTEAKNQPPIERVAPRADRAGPARGKWYPTDGK
jgi:hypothetical protein